MSPTLGLTLAMVLFLGLPSGLILLTLGLFRRGPRNMCPCGYDCTGVPARLPCPECGGPHPECRDIPRVRWQIYLGGGLLGAAGLAGLVFVMYFLRVIL